MTDKLPPLPEPVGVFYVNEETGVWTQYRRAPRPLTDGDAEFFDADHMHAYGKAREDAARAQALEDAAREVDKAIGEAIAGHFNKQAISALMQTRDMLKDRAMKGTT